MPIYISMHDQPLATNDNIASQTNPTEHSTDADWCDCSEDGDIDYENYTDYAIARAAELEAEHNTTYINAYPIPDESDPDYARKLMQHKAAADPTLRLLMGLNRGITHHR